MATIEIFARYNEVRDYQTAPAGGSSGEGSAEQLEDVTFDLEQASLNQPIPENNIGHRLLVKQGWQAGQGLGKSLQGHHEDRTTTQACKSCRYVSTIGKLFDPLLPKRVSAYIRVCSKCTDPTSSHNEAS